MYMSYLLKYTNSISDITLYKRCAIISYMYMYMYMIMVYQSSKQRCVPAMGYYICFFCFTKLSQNTYMYM